MRLGKICVLLRLSLDTDLVSKHVRSWHKADMFKALTNVGFGGQSGHDADTGQCPLMTQSGRSLAGKQCPRAHSQQRINYRECQKNGEETHQQWREEPVPAGRRPIGR